MAHVALHPPAPSHPGAPSPSSLGSGPSLPSLPPASSLRYESVFPLHLMQVCAQTPPLKSPPRLPFYKPNSRPQPHPPFLWLLFSRQSYLNTLGKLPILSCLASRPKFPEHQLHVSCLVLHPQHLEPRLVCSRHSAEKPPLGFSYISPLKPHVVEGRTGSYRPHPPTPGHVF